MPGKEVIMTGIEIFLIVIGVLAFGISFLCDKQLKKMDNKSQDYGKDISDEFIHKKINEVIDEIIDEKVESTEVKIEKILNEKIMTVGEYSDNVISEIDKNHNEVMFLYGMLSDKEKEVKNTLIDIENIKKSIKKAEDIQKGGSLESDFDVVKNNLSDKDNKKINKDNKSTKLSDNKVNNKGKSGSSKGTAKQGKKKNNNEMILELYSQGKTPVEIAKGLKIGIGEVRLVIDLYKNRG